jgi:hypothetical protein
MAYPGNVGGRRKAPPTIPPYAKIIVQTASVLALSACATQTGFDKNPDGSIEEYGFFSGIWHGLICPITLTLKLILAFIKIPLLIANYALDWHAEYLIDFFMTVYVIGEPNDGFYYFGFLLGLSSWFGGGPATYQKIR